mmetsp:Transcript_41241/g.128803  ORF Transcript_41241/g.128803 Transcript_41241/m.128803 type:complete len:594 (-) Transcript_41241:459-2240(-)
MLRRQGGNLLHPSLEGGSGGTRLMGSGGTGFLALCHELRPHGHSVHSGCGPGAQHVHHRRHRALGSEAIPGGQCQRLLRPFGRRLRLQGGCALVGEVLRALPLRDHQLLVLLLRLLDCLRLLHQLLGLRLILTLALLDLLLTLAEDLLTRLELGLPRAAKRFEQLVRQHVLQPLGRLLVRQVKAVRHGGKVRAVLVDDLRGALQHGLLDGCVRAQADPLHGRVCVAREPDVRRVLAQATPPHQPVLHRVDVLVRVHHLLHVPHDLGDLRDITQSERQVVDDPPVGHPGVVLDVHRHELEVRHVDGPLIPLHNPRVECPGVLHPAVDGAVRHCHPVSLSKRLCEVDHHSTDDVRNNLPADPTDHHGGDGGEEQHPAHLDPARPERGADVHAPDGHLHENLQSVHLRLPQARLPAEHVGDRRPPARALVPPPGDEAVGEPGQHREGDDCLRLLDRGAQDPPLPPAAMVVEEPGGTLECQLAPTPEKQRCLQEGSRLENIPPQGLPFSRRWPGGGSCSPVARPTTPPAQRQRKLLCAAGELLLRRAEKLGASLDPLAAHLNLALQAALREALLHGLQLLRGVKLQGPHREAFPRPA